MSPDKLTPYSNEARILIGVASLRDLILSAYYTSSETGQPPLNRELLVLYELRGHKTSRPGVLARKLAVSPGSMTMLLDRLEKRGMVSRSTGRHNIDRRIVSVTITPDGETFIENVLRLMRSSLQDVGIDAAKLAKTLAPLIDEKPGNQ